MQPSDSTPKAQPRSARAPSASAPSSSTTGTRTRSGCVDRLQGCPTRHACGLPATARHILAVSALFWGVQAQALQVLEASDGVAVEGVISIKEPTRIRIEGAAVMDVFGNIHTSHCGGSSATSGIATPGGLPGAVPTSSNPAGEVVVACDRDKGEVYVRPVGPGTKPINLFISSATATYTLVLRRADTPADTLVIRDRTPRALRSSAAATPGEPAGPAPSHVRAMKALLTAMSSDRLPHDVQVAETVRPVSLWAEARFTLLRLYEGKGLVGELYALDNVSASPLVMAEQEFDRPEGPGNGEIVGVAVDRHTLMPGESTRVYVIRRGSSR